MSSFVIVPPQTSDIKRGQTFIQILVMATLRHGGHLGFSKIRNPINSCLSRAVRVSTCQISWLCDYKPLRYRDIGDFRKSKMAAKKYWKSPISLNLRDLKSHDHAIWHVGPLTALDVHGKSGFRIFENPRWPPCLDAVITNICMYVSPCLISEVCYRTIIKLGM